MQLTIFGASGKTGRLLVEQALAQGHQVKALVRSVDKLGASHERLKVIQGDVLDANKVAEAVAGSEAVLSVLGPSPDGQPGAVTRGMENILKAMRQHGVRRLVVSTGAGVRDPKDRPTFVHALFGTLVKLLSRRAYEDMHGVVETVRGSEVDWTIVRVPRLTDDAKRGQVYVGYVGPEMKPFLTRADMADFMLRQATNGQHLRQAPAISN